MIISRYMVILAAAVFISTAFCGCAGGNRDENESTLAESEEIKVILSERQKQILEDQGLSTDYEMLESHQKSAILSIEEMLNYLEERTGKRFIYLGYVPNGPLDDEHLTCYEDGTPETRVITVKREYMDGQYVYSDDYEAVSASLEYAEVLTKYLTEEYGAEDLYVFYRAGLSSGEPGEVSGYAEVCLDEEKTDAEQAQAMAKAICEWAVDEYRCRLFEVRIYLTKAEAIRQMEEVTYDYVINDSSFSRMVTGILSSDGEINVF